MKNWKNRFFPRNLSKKSAEQDKNLGQKEQDKFENLAMQSPVPGEILEDIFAYLSRDALEHCEIICLKWIKIIGASKRLAQRRIVSLNYNRNYPYNAICNRFWVELKSPTGKTIRIKDYRIRQKLPASRFFKNIIIDELLFEDFLQNIHFLEGEVWMKFFKLAAGRIIVKSITIRNKPEYGAIDLKRIHDSLPKYFDAEEIEMNISVDSNLSDKELWKYLDFGEKTELYIYDNSHCYFSSEIFKEFISGRYMEHPKLNGLTIYLAKAYRLVAFSSVVEAFCNSDEPQKFFKSITTFADDNFVEIVGTYGFVRDNLDPRKYQLAHPKLNWALEVNLVFESDQILGRYLDIFLSRCLNFKSIEL